MNKRSFFYISSFFLSLLTTFYSQTKKDWTFATYIAADNDLNYFSGRNLDDMAKIGSNSRINIVAHLDKQGIHEKTKRIYVEKNKLVQVNYNDNSYYQKLDSGSASTLIDFFDWVVRNYPANNYALILWNHGSGILDNVGGKRINPSDLFITNPQTNMLEIDRTISYLEYTKQQIATFAQQELDNLRGVCFSDTYNTFLTNQKLDFALKTIQEKVLHGKKINIIGYDACLMGMIEVANLIKPYANIGVFSQELELGSGWKYDEVLRPFLTQTLTQEEFACNMVAAYNTAYQLITYDYTLSAVSLTKLNFLETALNQVSLLLIDALKYQQNNSVSNVIKSSKSRRLCTHFSEPSYIDLDHFLTNIYESIDYMTINPDKNALKPSLKIAITLAKNHLTQSVLAHTEGKNLARARGLSIHFPSQYIDATYIMTPFAKSNAWARFIQLAL